MILGRIIFERKCPATTGRGMGDKLTHKALLLRGCSRVTLSLVGVIAVTAATLVPADAKHYRAHVVSHGSGGHEGESSSPRYADIVVDANTGSVLHAAAADELRHPASLTKIMTLYLLFERIEAGKIKLDTELPVSEHASVQAPTKLGLKPGRTIAVEDAIRGLVTKSANDAAVVVAEALGGTESDFAEMMTKKAHALGMSRTEYHNASGLPNDAQLTTARDQALLGRAIQERFPRYYRYFSTQSFTYHGETMGNHNHLLGHVEGVDGIKTGYTQASGFNLVTSVHRNNRHIVAVVLGGTSGGARDARMRSLIEEYITTASIQHSAPLIAENVNAKAIVRAAEAKPETAKHAGTYEVASVPQQTSPQNSPQNSPQDSPQQNWPASKFAAARRDATAAVATKVAAAAADDTIKPIPVKTIKVRLTQMQTAGLGPIITVETPAAAPKAVASVAKPVAVAPPPAPVAAAPVAAQPVAPTPAAPAVIAAAEPIVATPAKTPAPAVKPAAMTLASAASVPVPAVATPVVATPVAPTPVASAPVASPVAAAPVATPVAPPAAPMATQVAPPVAPVTTAAATERVFAAAPAFRATKVPVSVAGLTQNAVPPAESVAAETAAPESASAPEPLPAATPVAAPVQKTPAIPGKSIATAPPAVEAAAPVVEASAPEAKAAAAARTVPPRGWVIQVGAFDAEHDAQQRLNIAHAKIGHVLDRADPFTEPVVKGEKTLYRARFAGFQQKDEAEAVCKQLKRNDIDCMTIKN
jgi:D-alanyl-D-alanine carboxypeptidase